jgi:hypothetical protein
LLEMVTNMTVWTQARRGEVRHPLGIEVYPAAIEGGTEWLPGALGDNLPEAFAGERNARVGVTEQAHGILHNILKAEPGPHELIHRRTGCIDYLSTPSQSAS